MRTISLLFIFIISFAGCAVDPEPIKIGSDSCHFCKMTISDNKFGAEIITTKGKIFKYDDVKCLLSEIKNGGVVKFKIQDYYFTDFSNEHDLINGKTSIFLKSDKLKAPMGGNIAVFAGHDDTYELFKKQLGGEEVNWNDLLSAK